MNSSAPIKITPHKHPLSALQRVTLDKMCDLMIPASNDGRMPAASTLQLYDDVSELSSDELAHFASALDRLETGAQAEHSESFANLDLNTASTVLEGARLELRQFISAFTVQTAARYLAHDIVLPLIGLEARAPWPQGNHVDDGDWSLLDPVKTRAPMYRVPPKTG